MKSKLLFGVLLSIISSSVYAHSGHIGSSFLAGFIHPFTGIDHLLVMLAIGLWAGKIGGTARWQLPLIFLLMMTISAIFAFNSTASLEMGIAVSVMAMGLFVALNLSINRAIQFGLTSIFAMLHGFAHGSELSLTYGYEVLFGTICATALLHGAGLLLALQQNRTSRYIHVALGWFTFCAGSYFLLLS